MWNVVLAEKMYITRHHVQTVVMFIATPAQR